MAPIRRDRILITNKSYSRLRVPRRRRNRQARLADLGQLGSNEEGGLDLHADALALVLGVERLREKLDEGLGARVEGEQGRGVTGGGGGEVDDGALLLGHHGGQDEAGHVQGGGDVELDEGVDLVFGELVEVHGEVVALPDVIDEHANVQALDGLAHLGLGGLIEVAEVDAWCVLRAWGGL